MDSSKDGVIFFSLGSKLKSNDLPQEVKNDLIKMLGTLKQTVIWKFEHDPDAVLPKNVHIMNWAPQASILGKYVEVRYVRGSCKSNYDISMV